MTMRIKITNEDTHRTALVEQIDFNPNDPNAAGGSRCAIDELPPGESKDVWIHCGRRVVVHERQS
jgi:hypothetical protein